MGILCGFLTYALYLMQDSYDFGSTSLSYWNARNEEDFDFSAEYVVFWPERPVSIRGKKLKSLTKSYSATVLYFDGSLLLFWSSYIDMLMVSVCKLGCFLFLESKLTVIYWSCKRFWKWNFRRTSQGKSSSTKIIFCWRFCRGPR